MLDAGMPEKAVEFFTPLVEQHGHSLALRALIVEAFGMLKKQDEAKAQVAFMAKVYEPLSAPGASRSAEQAAELGWFNLAYQVRPKVALEWAKLMAED